MTGSRLAYARMARGLTQKALAEQVGVSPKMLSNYEKNLADPCQHVTERLAQALDFSVAYLCMDDVEAPGQAALSFRARSKMPQRQRAAAQAHALFGIELWGCLDTHLDLPGTDVPDLSGLEPETAAQTLRAEWSLGQQPVTNVMRLLETHGIRTACADDIASDMDAFSLWGPDETPYVFLTTAKSPERERFDAAHELGHLVLHREVEQTTSAAKALEQEADAFASAFLMPRTALAVQIPDGLMLAQALRIKKVWGVSLFAVLVRAHNLGLTSDWEYRNLCERAGKMGARTSEPESMPRERSWLNDQVLNVLRKHPEEESAVLQETALPYGTVRALMFAPLPRVVFSGGTSIDPPNRDEYRMA